MAAELQQGRPRVLRGEQRGLPDGCRVLRIQHACMHMKAAGAALMNVASPGQLRCCGTAFLVVVAFHALR